MAASIVLENAIRRFLRDSDSLQTTLEGRAVPPSLSKQAELDDDDVEDQLSSRRFIALVSNSSEKGIEGW